VVSGWAVFRKDRVLRVEEEKDVVVEGVVG